MQAFKVDSVDGNWKPDFIICLSNKFSNQVVIIFCDWLFMILTPSQSSTSLMQHCEICTLTTLLVILQQTTFQMKCDLSCCIKAVLISFFSHFPIKINIIGSIKLSNRLLLLLIAQNGHLWACSNIQDMPFENFLPILNFSISLSFFGVGLLAATQVYACIVGRC